MTRIPATLMPSTIRTIARKAGVSGINSAVAFLASVPVALATGTGWTWMLSVITAFFLHNVFALLLNGDRCIGSMLFGRASRLRYSFLQRATYRVLYTLSFATLFLWVYLPFDLFLLNMFLLQLPTLIARRQTFHGYLAGVR